MPPWSESPFLRAVAQAIAISAAANIVGQIIGNYRDRKPLYLDPGELGRFLLMSAISSPLNYLWQDFLERKFPDPKLATLMDADEAAEILVVTDPQDHGSDVLRLSRDGEVRECAFRRNSNNERSSTRQSHLGNVNFRNTFMKWLIDCFLLGIWWNVLLFLVIMGILKHKSGSEVLEAIRVDMVPLALDGFKIWPLAAVFALTLVPVQKRIVFYSGVGFCWGVYLSLFATNS